MSSKIRTFSDFEVCVTCDCLQGLPNQNSRGRRRSSSMTGFYDLMESKRRESGQVSCIFLSIREPVSTRFEGLAFVSFEGCALLVCLQFTC